VRVQPAPITLRQHVLIYDLNENEELGAIAVLGQMLMAVTALVAIVANRIAIVGVTTPGR
jgi:hypothetical protein